MITSNAKISPNPHDEIDFLEILNSIWQQKKTILISIVAAGAMGLIYCIASTKEYEVSSLLRPTSLNYLDALNRSEVYNLTPTNALNRVGGRLESYDARFNFFKNNPKLFEHFQSPEQTIEQSFEDFNRNSISLSLSDPEKTEANTYLKLKMRYPEGVDGASILNGFVDYALALEREQISADLKVIIDNRLAEVQGKIAAARSNYEAEKESKIAQLLEKDRIKRAQLQDELQGLRLQMKITRENRISELGEAAFIAKAMGIRRPTTPSSMSTSGQAIRTEVNNQTIPLYFMGTDALEAEQNALKNRSTDDFSNTRIAEISKELKILNFNREIEVLNQRKNEDIFLKNIEPLRTEKARLSAINIDMESLNLVAVDRRAQEPLEAVKPQKILIIGLSLCIGFFVGAVLALLRQSFLRRLNIVAIGAFEAPLIVRSERAGA